MRAKDCQWAADGDLAELPSQQQCWKRRRTYPCSRNADSSDALLFPNFNFACPRPPCLANFLLFAMSSGIACFRVYVGAIGSIMGRLFCDICIW